MSYYRSYFSKNNTIISDSLVNTAKNPTTEIFYGDGYSKFIFQIDLSSIRLKIDNGDLILNSDTKHYLRMTNTIFGSESFVGQEKGTGGHRATSFDLTLIPLTETDWDEGVGFDYDVTDDLSFNDNKTYDIRPSNWYNKTTLNEWTVPGIYETITGDSITIHFDNGNENINQDISEIVNHILTGTTGNSVDFVLAFDPLYFTNDDGKQSISFFTKYTQTFYEPFVETIFNDVIIDNRTDFISEINNSLYLYVSKNGSYVNLDSEPIVTISDSTNTDIVGLSGMTSQLVRKGVYKITFGISGLFCDGKRFYYDKWDGIGMNGAGLSMIRQKFVPKLYDEMFDIGAISTNNHIIKFSGIKLNEKIKRGEIRKVVVNVKSFNTLQTIVSGELYYRIYIKEGKTQVNVFDWTLLDKTTENSFLIDTSYLIPREYNIEIKSKIGDEVIFFENEIKFEIVSEK